MKPSLRLESMLDTEILSDGTRSLNNEFCDWIVWPLDTVLERRA